jgi:hypothetical protein
MGARAELLTAEIEQTKRELAANLADFKVELSELSRKVLIGAGALAAVFVVWRLLRRRRRKRRG